MESRVRAICINPAWIPLVRSRHSAKELRLVTVISFPLGADSTMTKVAAARSAIDAGASELDIVARLDMALAGDFDGLQREVESVRHEVNTDTMLKMIVEMSHLADNLIVPSALALANAGADVIKTGTGYHPLPHERHLSIVRRLADELPKGIGIKAAGGIRTRVEALALLDAGARMIGSSRAFELLD